MDHKLLLLQVLLLSGLGSVNSLIAAARKAAGDDTPFLTISLIREVNERTARIERDLSELSGRLRRAGY